MEQRNPVPGRITELDTLRGLAALAVLICHLPRGFWFGETAVDLFFVLSGYLITAIILRNCDRDRFLRTFYIRRSFRIWPIYYLAIAAVVAVNLVRQTPDALDGLPYYLTYLQNIQLYWGGDPPAMTSLLSTHLWTLAIEEQFYLIWPPLLLLLGRRFVTPMALFLALLPAVLRAFGLSRAVLFGHCDGLALGALLASLRSDPARIPSARESAAYLTLFLGALGLYGGLWALLSSKGFTGKQMIAYNPSIILISLSYFGLIGFVVCNTGRSCLKWLRVPALASLGQISYGLYLYHWIVYELIDTGIKFGLGYKDPWWLDVIKVAASFAVALLSWQYFEKPLLAWKDRFDYGRGRASRTEDALVPGDRAAAPRENDARLDPAY